MIRRAEWRRLPTDPIKPLGWMLHELRGFAVAWVLTVGFFAAFATLAFQFGLWLPFLLCFVAAWIFGYLILLTRHSLLVQSISTLGAKPEPAKTYPVAFSIHRDGICTGQDRGIATLVGGWLHVEGLHTTFSLRPVDIVETSTRRESRGGLVLTNGQIVRIESLAWGRTNRTPFEDAVRSWRHFPFELPTGESVFPPQRVHGSAIRQPLVGLMGAVAGFLVNAGVIAWLLGSMAVGALLIPLFSLAYTAYLAATQVHVLATLRQTDLRALPDGQAD